MTERPTVIPAEEVERALAEIAPDMPTDYRHFLAERTKSLDPEILEMTVGIFREFFGLSQAERDNIDKRYREASVRVPLQTGDKFKELYKKGQRLCIFNCWKHAVEKFRSEKRNEQK